MRNPVISRGRRYHLRLVGPDECAVDMRTVDAANAGLRALQERLGRPALYRLVSEDPDALDAIATSDPVRLLVRLSALTLVEENT